MKEFMNIKKRVIRYVACLSLTFSLFSCVSYYGVSYYDDGIYGSPPPEYGYEVRRSAPPKPVKANQYEAYFGKVAQQYNSDNTDSYTPFTDVEQYSSGSYESGQPAQPSYAGWGQNASQVSINVYDNSYWNSLYWGWNNPWWSYGAWRPYNSWGWAMHTPYRSGWHFQWSWGGYYSPYWYDHYYGYYHPYGYWNDWYWYGYGGGYYPQRRVYASGGRNVGSVYQANQYGNRSNRGYHTIPSGRPYNSTVNGNTRNYQRYGNGTYTPSQSRTYNNTNSTTGRNYNNSASSGRNYSNSSSVTRNYDNSTNRGSYSGSASRGYSNSTSRNYENSASSGRNYSNSSSATRSYNNSASRGYSGASSSSSNGYSKSASRR